MSLPPPRNLKVIGRAGIGVDNIDIPAATARGIVVMNTPFGNSITTAEHAIALLFAAARQIAAADASTQAGKWEKNRFMGVELYAKTLGLIGCGNIGALVAERALALKMKVIAYDPFLSPERAIKLGVEKVELDDLLSRADAISLHTPLTDKTKNILSAEALGKTKSGVIIVNAARGGLVDEAALACGARERAGRGRGFDVFVTEPAKQSVLFGAPNFVATPHLGASTNEAQENVALQVAEQISDYLLTGAVTNALNMASISAEEASRLKPFIGLIDKLGAFAGQIADDGLEAIEIEYEGDVAHLNTQPLTAIALACDDATADARREHGVRARRAETERHAVDRIQARYLADLWIPDPDQGSHGGALADARRRGQRGNREDRRSQGHGPGSGFPSGDAAYQQSGQTGVHRRAGHDVGGGQYQYCDLPPGPPGRRPGRDCYCRCGSDRA